MEIEKADVVVSLAGRDRGKLFFVIEADEAYVTIADGKGRKLEHPKRKKRKHVQRVSVNAERVQEKLLSGGKVLNSELRRELAIAGQTLESQEGK
ncbi:MAG: hypothetical protein HFF08_09410 [Oscillospiraceae bacterium]|nr:hypothetical protein [Oscillospiraceae bacterium]